MNDLKQFRQLHSQTPGHPEVHIPGVEATTGPLGQGVGMGIGMAAGEILYKIYVKRILVLIHHFYSIIPIFFVVTVIFRSRFHWELHH